MALTFLNSLKISRANAIISAVGVSGLLRIYDGTPPGSVNVALSGNTLLAELVCAATLGTVGATGNITFNAVADDASANATGTASFFRLLTSGGTAVVQGSVGVTGGGADLQFPTTAFEESAVVNISSFVITAGN